MTFLDDAKHVFSSRVRTCTTSGKTANSGAASRVCTKALGTATRLDPSGIPMAYEYEKVPLTRTSNITIVVCLAIAGLAVAAGTARAELVPEDPYKDPPAQTAPGAP